MNQQQSVAAPELEACHWINCEDPLSITQLRGTVIVLHAFQMLCPGCVAHGIPQASAIHALYSKERVQVIGIHTVFEHHEVMTIEALEAFVEEYGLRFPIVVDSPSDSSAVPLTMSKYQLRGTPSLVLIDKWGNIRANHFGRLSDMEVGNLIGQLLTEEDVAPAQEGRSKPSATITASPCRDEGCELL
ncbi:MAG: hypothetical protein DHS20C12_09280 [Pseudohongiella sp.]|nr:MAG: hypothetical protein DHS20C12_09280 [Pseudohongiella sp.]